MPELTICIPAASYHASLVDQAVASVKAQTIPCDVLVYRDGAGAGAGYARNMLLKQVTSPFVTFLDADDTLEPNFAEHCLQVWGAVSGTRYVYTNWRGASRVFAAVAPCDMWRHIATQQLAPNERPEDYDVRGTIFVKRTFHPVTTLIPTEYALRIGGFDENMSALEDADFYRRLIISGVCGVHLNETLFNYRAGGQRSTTARIVKDGMHPEQVMMHYMDTRYKEYTMGCCGDSTPGDIRPTNDPLPGDILAQSLWNGNRQERGLATGRIYPRSGNGKLMHVAAEDIAMSPGKWKRVHVMPSNTPPVLAPGYQAQPVNWKAAGDAAFGGQAQQTPLQPAQMEWIYHPVENTRTVNDVLKIAQSKKK